MAPLPERMRAMVLERPGQPLLERMRPVPEPGAGQVLLRVLACGVCRTDLHVRDGELPHPTLPLIPGHEVVGEVVTLGDGVTTFSPGQRVGVPWLAHTCGVCHYCRTDRENLCERAAFTGYTRDGGYAQYALADAHWCLALPADLDPVATAPLLCAGLIGYRCWRFAALPDTPGVRLGLYGFGAAAHLVAQLAMHAGQAVYAFTRPGDAEAQDFARGLGCIYAGDANALPPAPLDAAIIFAPVGELVPAALAAVRPGATVVCGGIHMSDIPAFPYRLLWQERRLVSVANLTRRDGHEFIALAAEVGLAASTRRYRLDQANEALEDLRHGRFSGAAVLVP